MSDQIERPYKVTKPIQLLAAWLGGLTVVDASFLSAAKLMGSGTFECRALVVAAIINVYVFIVAIFVLQTKFRPELQEDLYYSQYISKKTGNIVSLSKIEILEKNIEELRHVNVSLEANKTDELNWYLYKVAINDNLPFFAELQNALIDAKINISDVFGKSKGIEKQPFRKLISVDNSCPARYVIPLLQVCANFQFDGFYRWDRMEDAEEESFYLGAYGQADSGIVYFSESVVEQLAAANSEADLAALPKKRKR